MKCNIYDMNKEEIISFVKDELRKIDKSKIRINKAGWGYHIRFKVDDISIKIWTVWYYNQYLEEYDGLGDLVIKQGWSGKKLKIDDNIMGMEDLIEFAHKECKLLDRNYVAERDVRMHKKYEIEW